MDAKETVSERSQALLPKWPAKRAEWWTKRVDTYRGQANEQIDLARQIAEEQLETARLYVLDRVQERPFVSTLAGGRRRVRAWLDLLGSSSLATRIWACAELGGLWTWAASILRLSPARP